MPHTPVYWILDEQKRPVEAGLFAWAEFFGNIDNRRVGYTEFEDGIYVSTVFLGLDHRFLGDGPPLLFETMIFNGPLDGYQCRYASWDDAETGHRAAVRRVKEARVQQALEKTNGPP